MSLGDALFWIAVEIAIFMGAMTWLYFVQLRFWRKYYALNQGPNHE